jgi:hypothetical protein
MKEVKENDMNSLDIVQILRIGVIGLGFFLAYFSYRLLSKEQKKEKPRSSVIRAVYIFMAFSVALCLIGIYSQFIKERKTAYKAIGEAIYYLDLFNEYRMRANKLAEKAEELIKNPNETEQELLNSEIKGLVRSVTMERQNSEKFQQQLNGELDEVSDALSKGNANAINNSLKALNTTLKFKHDRLIKDLTQPQNNSASLEIGKAKVTVRLFNVNGDAYMHLNNGIFMGASGSFKGIMPKVGIKGWETPYQWDHTPRTPGDTGEIDITSNLKVGVNTFVFFLSYWNIDYDLGKIVSSLSVEVKVDGKVEFSDDFRITGDKESVQKYMKKITVRLPLRYWILNKFSW